MDELGWEPLRNRHLLVERGGDTLVFAGVDDVTAEASGLEGRCAHLAGALNGADPDLPVLLVAHQPKFVDRAVAADIDLQLSGQTHGARSGPSTTSSASTSPPSPASATAAPTPSSTPAASRLLGPAIPPREITLPVLRSPHMPTGP
ncbi:hypothetical protein M2271_006906 [Streptomyces sp. LBL]|nr:hypothetical protein [Streptomyces sp. LBL]